METDTHNTMTGPHNRIVGTSVNTAIMKMHLDWLYLQSELLCIRIMDVISAAKWIKLVSGKGFNPIEFAFYFSKRVIHVSVLFIWKREKSAIALVSAKLNRRNQSCGGLYNKNVHARRIIILRESFFKMKEKLGTSIMMLLVCHAWRKMPYVPLKRWKDVRISAVIIGLFVKWFE